MEVELLKKHCFSGGVLAERAIMNVDVLHVPPRVRRAQ